MGTERIFPLNYGNVFQCFNKKAFCANQPLVCLWLLLSYPSNLLQLMA